MSTNQLTPTWLIQNQSMASSFVSQTVTCEFEDNIGIQIAWTGNPVGVFDIQVSMDPTNLGWQSVPFVPTPDQPAGIPGHTWYDFNQCPGGFVRLSYTATSGTGTLNSKIAIKSV